MINPDKLLIDQDWRGCLGTSYNSASFKDLCAFLNERVASDAEIYPSCEQIFTAFNLTRFSDVRVVILGQDPYHGPGQAMGLSFSVPPTVKIPPSLRNIFKEIETDTGGTSIVGGDLTPWAEQGTLLLNSVLTVEKGDPGVHANKGWETFTDQAIVALSQRLNGIVFLLWGAYAQKKAPLIDSAKHFVLTAAHPSPFSAYRGFMGCQHFSKTNDIISRQGGKPIVW